MRPSLICCAALLAAFSTVPGLATSSAIHATEGGDIRLVTSGLADADGVLRGALLIELRPGWKTYWRDPGASGVPPEIDIAGSVNVAGAEIGFPPPQWHEDGYGAWAGYDRPVALPVAFTLPQPERFSVIEARVFLGICQSICIPVEARFSLEPGADPDNAEDAATVAAAKAAMPAEAAPGFRVSGAKREGRTLHVAVETPAGSKPELFLAGSGGYAFARPEPSDDGFEVRILAEPTGAEAVEIDYVLTAGGSAAAGRFAIP